MMMMMMKKMMLSNSSYEWLDGRRMLYVDGWVAGRLFFCFYGNSAGLHSCWFILVCCMLMVGLLVSSYGGEKFANLSRLVCLSR